jgi:hypothetical protein
MRTALFLKMGHTGCPDASVTNYQRTFCNIPKELRYQLHRNEKPGLAVLYSHEGQKNAYRVFVVRPEVRGSLAASVV